VIVNRPPADGLDPTFTCRMLPGANVTLAVLLIVSVPTFVKLLPGRTTPPAPTCTVRAPPSPTVPLPPRIAPELTATFDWPVPDLAVLFTSRVPALTVVVPEYVLFPETARMPGPFLANPVVALLMTPPRVVVPVPRTLMTCWVPEADRSTAPPRVRSFVPAV